MKIKLTLQEKLRDLRDEKKLTLSDLSGETNIPLSTLQRMEGQDDIRVGYQDVAALAKFYEVSTDYLFGLTDNRQHRHIAVDALKLSDAAIETLTGEKFNNRLVSELLALLQESVVDEDEYLRYRISERFNDLMKKLFDAHKKDALPDEQAGVIQELKDGLQDYPAKKEQAEKERWKLTFLAKQIGLNITELTDEEIHILIKTLQKSGKYKQGRRR